MGWKEFIVGIIEALAWPVVVVFAIVALKDNLPHFLRKLAEKLKLAKYKDAELHFSSQEQLKVENPVESSKLNTLMPKELTGLQLEIKNLILSQLEAIESDEDKIKVLVGNLSHAQAQSSFEKIEFTIFGSQIRLLEYMNSKGTSPCTKEEVHRFYREARMSNPELFNVYLFESYISYLEGFGLISRQNEEWVLNSNGRDFLVHMAQPGKSKTKSN